MPNIWGVVGGVQFALPMAALLGTPFQLLGMDATGTQLEYKNSLYNNATGQFYVPNGTYAAPSLSFASSLGTGFLYDAANVALGVSVQGVQRVRFDAAKALFSVNLKLFGTLLQEAQSANIVAAANIDFANATGNYVYVTNAAGDVSITRLGGNLLPQGTCIEVKFVIAGGTITLKNDNVYLALFGATDLKVLSGDVCRFRKTNGADQMWELVSYNKGSSGIQIISAATQPRTLVEPVLSDRPAMVAGGWLPWNLNQQWGGAPMPFHLVDSATGTEFKFDAFDAYIEPYGVTAQEFNFGDAAGSYFRAQSIVAPKNQSLQAIWVKIYKVANPVDNVTLKLWSVAAGVPNAIIATANTINGKQITSDAAGQWYRFSFAAVQALVAGTQYMITLEKSGGLDAVNFYRWKGAQPNKNPNNLFSNGTAVPAWTPANTASGNIIAEAQASDQVVQAGGTFSAKIVGSEGNPINHSVGFIKPLREFFPLFSPNGWSILIRGKTWTKDRTIAELMYGLHHDRINIRSATVTGITTVTVYKTDGTVVTLVGAADVSGATYKDILITGRSVGDGADYLRIYTGIANVWAKEAELTAQTFTFDPLFLLQGHMWLMGGFQLFSNASYTKLSDMGLLPSADGWTFTTTTATVEGNVFSVNGGKLSQIRSGMAAGGDGFYRKAALAFSNANGWLAVLKLRTISGTGTKDENGCIFTVSDGTKAVAMRFQEYWSGLSSTTTYYPQLDLKSADSTAFMSGKGSDCLGFINGRLVDDHTSQILAGTANNQIDFGDTSVAAGENADIIYDYVGYYNTSNIYPQFTSGELHEFGVWDGEQATLGQALYNAGAPVSIKQYCGIDKNWIGAPVNLLKQQVGITPSPTNASASPQVIPELECFVLGEYYQIRGNAMVGNSGANSNGFDFYIDGRLLGANTYDAYTSTIAISPVANNKEGKTNFGLHKIEVRSQTNAGLTTFDASTRRTLHANFSAGVP